MSKSDKTSERAKKIIDELLADKTKPQADTLENLLMECLITRYLIKSTKIITKWNLSLALKDLGGL